MVDHFQSLGLDATTATQALARDAYRRLIRAAHPDQAPDSSGLATSATAAWNVLKNPLGFEAHRREILARRAFLAAAAEVPGSVPGAPDIPDSELAPGYFPSYLARVFRDALNEADAAEAERTRTVSGLLGRAARWLGARTSEAPASAAARHMPYRIVLEGIAPHAQLKLYFATSGVAGRNLIALPHLKWDAKSNAASYSQTRALVVVRALDQGGVAVLSLDAAEAGAPEAPGLTLVFEAA